MKNPQFNIFGLTSRSTAAKSTLLGLWLLVGAAVSALAQGQMASGTISGSGSGPYTYSLTFSNSASSTSPIGSVWYSWVPGSFFLPGDPTSETAPAGWTATPQANSIQFVASSSAFDIAAGQSLSGFGYTAGFSPAQLAAAANSGLSVAYSGALFSDNGNTFTVEAVTVPEPSAMAMLVFGAIGFRVATRRKVRTN
jgi:hypothetical protein